MKIIPQLHKNLCLLVIFFVCFVVIGRFGMSAIEAGACNLPVVCSRIYGLTDAVEKNITGLMHEPGNINRLKTV